MMELSEATSAEREMTCDSATSLTDSSEAKPLFHNAPNEALLQPYGGSRTCESR